MLKYTNQQSETPEGQELFMICYFSESYLDVKAKLRWLDRGPLTLLGRDILAKLADSISFSCTMCLHQDSSVIPLLMTLCEYTIQPESSYSLPPSLEDPKVWTPTHSL